MQRVFLPDELQEKAELDMGKQQLKASEESRTLRTYPCGDCYFGLLYDVYRRSFCTQVVLKQGLMVQ